jgi:hypothetical protein
MEHDLREITDLQADIQRDNQEFHGSSKILLAAYAKRQIISVEEDRLRDLKNRFTSKYGRL